MGDATMTVGAMAGFAAPDFHPILTDASAGHTFTMLGTTMRLIATAAGTGGRYTVLEQVTPPGWGPPRHIHSREDCYGWCLCGPTSRHSTRFSQRGVYAQSFVMRHHARRIRGVFPGGGPIFSTSRSTTTGRTGAAFRINSAATWSLTRKGSMRARPTRDFSLLTVGK